MRRSLPVVLVVAALALLAPGFVAAPRVAAADMVSARAWVTIGATKPAVGCTVPVAVEIHAGGVGLSQNEVSVALFVDDDVVAMDRAITDGDGVAYLSIDTSPTYAGANGWVDVNVSGAYIGGFSLIPNNGNSCEAGGKMLTIDATVPNVAASASADFGYAAGFPTYVQQRNLSCEYAAIQIATTAWGSPVSEYSIEAYVPLSPNPHWGYRGNIHGWWGNTTDYGVYAAPLAAALPNFGFVGEVFYAQGDSSQLTTRLDQGVPTLVWLGLWGDQSYYDYLEGSRYKLTAGMHVVVAYDYDEGGVYISDPAVGALTYYSWGDFMYYWNVLDGMALAVYPA